MAKTVLVLTGSPRKGGNSDLLAEAFIQGAQATGANVLRFDAGRAKIGGCMACGACWSKGTPCVFSDDYDKLYPLLEQADTLVLCSPLYWFTFPAQIKAAIDKLYPYTPSRTQRQLKIRDTYLLMCAHDDAPEAFEGAQRTYEQIVAYKGWRDKGILLVNHMGDKGDIVGSPALKQAEILGRTV